MTTYFKSKHNLCNHPLYNTWRDMRHRCYNKNLRNFHRYGGRGITVCKEWQKDFNTFYNWAMSNGWKQGLTLERINNNGNYEPTNCCFVTRKQQAQNRSTCLYLEAFGEIKLLKDWFQDSRCVASRSTVIRRLNLKWILEEALTTKPMKTGRNV